MAFIEELRQQTASAHQALEKDLVARIKSIYTKAQYDDLLKLMYGYYAAMEKVLEKYLSSDISINFAGRRKSAWLIDDLGLSGKKNDLVQCEELPRVGSARSALGAMYVLEGSTLGGQIIAKMIRQQLQSDDPLRLSFFQSYGANTPSMWARFKQVLDKPFETHERQAIITAANETFISFRNWISSYEAKKL